MPGERDQELLQVRRWEGRDLRLAQDTLAQFGSMAAQEPVAAEPGLPFANNFGIFSQSLELWV